MSLFHATKKLLSSYNWSISFLHNKVTLATDTVLVDVMDEDPLGNSKFLQVLLPSFLVETAGR